MRLLRWLAPVALVVLPAASPALASDADALWLRLFLSTGGSLVSYGEFARLDDRVVFSMPVGGQSDEPRLQVVSVPASAVDWARTDRYSAAARHDRYATTRGPSDYDRLTAAVARTLGTIARSTEPVRALDIATRARRELAAWPAMHYGYRQDDVEEIVGLLDEAIADLRARVGVGAFDLVLAARQEPPAREPLLPPPTSRDLLESVLAAAGLAERAQDRVALYHAAVVLVTESPADFSREYVANLTTSIHAVLRDEQAIDLRYSELSARVLTAAAAAAASGRVADVERAVLDLSAADDRLGGRRPDVVTSLRSALDAHLARARRRRLLLDRFAYRQGVYREYQRAAGTQLLQLVRARTELEAVRQVSGPDLDALERLHGRLQGGSAQLQRVAVPGDLQAAHDALVSAWRFAEQAVAIRHGAVRSADIETARQASSAAAAALLFLSDAQRQIRTFIEPPTPE